MSQKKADKNPDVAKNATTQKPVRAKSAQTQSPHNKPTKKDKIRNAIMELNHANVGWFWEGKFTIPIGRELISAQGTQEVGDILGVMRIECPVSLKNSSKSLYNPVPKSFTHHFGQFVVISFEDPRVDPQALPPCLAKKSPLGMTHLNHVQHIICEDVGLIIKDLRECFQSLVDNPE